MALARLIAASEPWFPRTNQPICPVVRCTLRSLSSVGSCHGNTENTGAMQLVGWSTGSLTVERHSIEHGADTCTSCIQKSKDQVGPEQPGTPSAAGRVRGCVGGQTGPVELLAQSIRRNQNSQSAGATPMATPPAANHRGSDGSQPYPLFPSPGVMYLYLPTLLLSSATHSLAKSHYF